MKFAAYPTDKHLCVVRLISLYLEKTSVLREKHDSFFFISYVIVYFTAYTHSVILIPLLVYSYLYYHGISNLSAISHINNITKKRPTNERILSYLNKKGGTNWDEKTVKEVLGLLRTKNLFNSNDIAESEENVIPNLQTGMSYI